MNKIDPTNTLPKIKVKKIKTNNAVKMAYMAVELARTKRERHQQNHSWKAIMPEGHPSGAL